MDETPGLQSSYDRVAAEYARQFCDEMDKKALDREMLDRLAREVGGRGAICDMGCGPGQIARFLHGRGAAVLGVDLSPEMVEQARRLNPGVAFKQGNMLSLDVEDDAWGGIAAFYSIIHIPHEQVVSALRELRRVLRPGGTLLLTFHIGQQVIHLEEWWERPVSIDFYYFQPSEMEGYLVEAGFEIEEIVVRPPYRDVEYQSYRAYVFARKPVG